MWAQIISKFGNKNQNFRKLQKFNGQIPIQEIPIMIILRKKLFLKKFPFLASHQ